MLRDLSDVARYLWERGWAERNAGNISNVFEAFDLIDIVAKAAQIYFHCVGAGLSPQGLTQVQIEELKRKYVAKE